jgi:hypothetical protein
MFPTPDEIAKRWLNLRGAEKVFGRYPQHTSRQRRMRCGGATELRGSWSMPRGKRQCQKRIRQRQHLLSRAAGRQIKVLGITRSILLE